MEWIWKFLMKLWILAIIVGYGYYTYHAATDRGEQFASQLQNDIVVAEQLQKEQEAGTTPMQRIIKSLFPVPPKPQQGQ